MIVSFINEHFVIGNAISSRIIVVSLSPGEYSGIRLFARTNTGNWLFARANTGIWLFARSNTEIWLFARANNLQSDYLPEI